MINNNGWISIHRKIQDSWLWEEKPFTRAQAWIDLLLLTSYKSEKKLIGNNLRFIERGTCFTSQKSLMKRWGWGSSKLRNFLKLLQQEEMITFSSDCKSTTIKIVNYDNYQYQNDLSKHVPIDSVDIQNSNGTLTEPCQNVIETQSVSLGIIGNNECQNGLSKDVSRDSADMQNSNGTLTESCQNTNRTQSEITNKDNNSNKNNTILDKISKYYLSKTNKKLNKSSIESLLKENIPLDIIKKGIDLSVNYNEKESDSFSSCIPIIHTLYSNLSDETQGTPNDIITKYCNIFSKLPTNIRPNELQSAINIYNTYPMEIIEKGILNAYNTAKKCGNTINTFNYCVPFIKNVFKKSKNNLISNKNKGEEFSSNGKIKKYSSEWFKSKEVYLRL